MMKIEDIKNPELKNHINMIYLHGENENPDGIAKTENEIIGRIVYTVDGIKIGEADLKLRDKVTKIEYFDLIEKLFKYICSAKV